MRVIRANAGFAAVLGAFLASGLAVAPAQAQSVAQVSRPAELPPAGFTGQQFVDSRGCVFMRAGFGGQVNWVPRIGRDRKPICNEVTPAQAAARLATGDGASPARSVGTPVRTVASAMPAGKKTGVFEPMAVPGLDGRAAGKPVQMPRKVVAPAPVVQAEAPPVRSSAGRSQYCPEEAPVLQTLPLATGGTVTVCTRGDGTATGWISPSARTIGGTIRDGAGQHGVPSAKITGGQTGQSAVAGQHVQAGQSGGYVQTVIAGQPVIAQRKAAPNYAAAWDDDRLNPHRGLGTQQGWADQGQVWTNTVPAQTHHDVARQKARKQAVQNAGRVARTEAVGQQRVTTSTMSSSGQMAATGGGRIYVQVGIFGQAANAQNAAGRLAGMGLPVASAKSVKSGRDLVAIMAGPFASSAQAQQALGMARSAGFPDAYIR